MLRAQGFGSGSSSDCSGPKIEVDYRGVLYKADIVGVIFNICYIFEEGWFYIGSEVFSGS
jgi:hypothetical protein